MLADSIVYFLALAASFFLFYFNVPYWTGKDMADMSDSGIWRAFFRFLSFVGYGVFKLFNKLFEMVALPVCGLLVGREKKGVIKDGPVLYHILGTMQIFLFAGFLWLLTNIYTGVMDGLFGSAPIADLAEAGGEGLLGFLSRGVCFLRVLVDFKRPTQPWTFGLIAAATITTLIGLVFYVIINTLFFSILYGLLRQLLDEVHPLDKLTFLQKQEKEKPAAPAGEEEPQGPKLGDLWEQIMDGVRGFLGKMTIFWSWRQPASVALTLVVLFLFSAVMTYFGKNDLSPLDVVKQVLDAIGLVQIVCSFIVTWLMGKLAEKGSRAVISHLPQGAQDAIHRLSAKGNAWADAQDAKRQGSAGSEEEPERPAPVKAAPVKPAPKPVRDVLPVSGGKASAEALSETLEFVASSAEASGFSGYTAQTVRERLDSGDTPLCREWQALKDKGDNEKATFLMKKVVDIVIFLGTGK